MKVLQINTNVNSGSTGRIAEDIGNVLLVNGHESYIAFGRGNRPSKSKLIRIGNNYDVYNHLIKTRLFDKHGFGSLHATKKLINEIERIKPDVIGLHNLHGYYINIQELFNYLNLKQYPVLWTLFDCWAFTGHCTYFDDIQCYKWEKQCFQCPKHRNYPAAWVDNSIQNYQIKKKLFSGNKSLQLVVHSEWLAGLVKKSFLGHIPIHVTPSAIDTDDFKPAPGIISQIYNLEGKKIILGCASIWTERKGLNDLIQLSKLFSEEFKIVVIGVSAGQKSKLPANVLGIERTENIQQLAEWYSVAQVFVNPTYQDNFPTTNIEALACGTPVITYDTGGSPEAIDAETGFVLKKGDISGIRDTIIGISAEQRLIFRAKCRERAINLYNRATRYLDYIEIMEKIRK